MIERRKYPRFELKVKANYKKIDSRDILKSDTTKNISAEGICFESEERFKPGTHVELEVDLGDRGKPVRVIGEIRWFMEVGGKGKRFVNGVKLIDVPHSDEGRFLKYYCDRMVEKLSGYLVV